MAEDEEEAHAKDRREAERLRREEIKAMTPLERMELAYRLFRLTREDEEREGKERGSDEDGAS